jgi:CheY-like chemotaxis protein
MSKKILAIDDSLTLREFINRCLSRHSSDYQVILAKDGKEGLELAAKEQPDLILLDFVLPDLKGDEVCRRLRARPETATLPGVLMSSSAADITRAQAEFDTVVKVIAKPFTPELLCATVGYVLREIGKRNAAAAPVIAPPAVEPRAVTPVVASRFEVEVAPVPTETSVEEVASQFSGDTGQFSLIAVLLALEQDHCTGVLRIYPNSEPIKLYVANGRPVLVTSRDVKNYLKESTHRFKAEQNKPLEALKREQAKSGKPIFLQMSEQRLMPVGEAAEACYDHGLRLFSQVWTAPRARFEFEAQAEMPYATADLLPYDGVMSDWAMETLRRAGDEFRSAMAWGEPTGIPAYTRRGYERIQQIPLNDEELAFAALISPTRSLEQIALALNMDVESAQRILHRFLCLEIFDYWPASLLRAA